MANYQSTHTGAQIDADLDLLDKNTATEGQVLTADGAGRASWQDASGTGGGTQLYRHNIYLQTSNGNYSAYCTLYSTSSNSFTFNDIYNYCNIAKIYLSGIMLKESSGSESPIFSIEAVSSNMVKVSYGTTVTYQEFTNTDNIADTVTPL